MSGSVTQRAFQRGYRQALRDVLQELDEGGAEAVRRWVLDNLEGST